MKTSRFFVFLVVATFAAVSHSFNVSAQGIECPRSDYMVGLDTCLHRYPWAVLNGCKEQREICNQQPQQDAQEDSKPPVYTVTTPTQAANAIICDIAAAAQATRGKHIDLSKSVIAADLTFSEVTKDSKGGSLAIAAIPVFSGASVAPSLDASRITSQTLQGTTSIEVEPSKLAPCIHHSPNNWLTSQAIIGSLPDAVKVKKIAIAVQFVLTEQASAGLNLNIVPVSIGPKFSNEDDKTQKLCLLFNFLGSDGKPMDGNAKPSCQFGSGNSNTVPIVN